MGLGLGAYVDPTRRGARRRAVPRLPGARACWPRRRCSRPRSRRRSRSWPGSSWSRIFHAMYATPITPRDIALGNLAWIAARLPLICDDLHARHRPVRGRRVAADRVRDPGRRPDRDGLRGTDRRLLRDAEDAETGSPRSSGSGSRRSSCSPARSSRSSTLPAALQVAGLAHAAVPRRRADPRRCRSARSARTRSRRSIHVTVPDRPGRRRGVADGPDHRAPAGARMTAAAGRCPRCRRSAAAARCA